METHAYANQSSSQSRPMAMLLALVSAVVLSPLYISRKKENRHEFGWSTSGFVLPMVLAGLIVAIKTTSSSSNSGQRGRRGEAILASPEEASSSVHSIGSSSWGLAGILVMLIFVLSWQSSVQHFFWR